MNRGDLALIPVLTEPYDSTFTASNANSALSFCVYDSREATVHFTQRELVRLIEYGGAFFPLFVDADVSRPRKNAHSGRT